MRSRAIAQATIVFLILLVVALLILLPLVWKLAKVMWAYSQGGVCQASAAISAVKVERACVMEATSPTPLRCPRRHVEIGPTKATVTVDGKSEPLKVVVDGRAVSSYAAPDAAVVDRVFADELLRCWEQFGAGEMALFTQADPGTWDWIESGLGNDFTACHVCSEIFFTGDIPAAVKNTDGTIKESDVWTFLQDMEVPGKKYNYIDRLNNPQAFCDDSLDNVKDGKCWDAQEEYFTRMKPQKMSSLEAVNATGGYAVLMVRKRFDSCDEDKVDMSLFAYVVPISDLSTKSPCNVFIS